MTGKGSKLMGFARAFEGFGGQTSVPEPCQEAFSGGEEVVGGVDTGVTSFGGETAATQKGIPAFAPGFVRPSFKRRLEDRAELTESCANPELNKMAAMRMVERSGALSLELNIEHPPFNDLHCELLLGTRGVSAIFRGGDDPNIRRLLEAELPKLRVKLENRGLRVISVRLE